jgi:hypothetical protein
VMTHPHDREIRAAGGRGAGFARCASSCARCASRAVKARDLVATLPGRLHAIAVEPLEMPAPSETPGPVPEDEHRPNRTERAAAARGPVPAP